MSAADQALASILTDFKLEQEQKEYASRVNFIGEVPNVANTNSQKINLSLVGAVPAAANALVAGWIFEERGILKERGGRKQVVEVDVGRGHNYIDPDVGMTPSLNGQVCIVFFFLTCSVWFVSRVGF